MSQDSTKGKHSIFQDLVIGIVSTIFIVSCISISLVFYLSYEKTDAEFQVKLNELAESVSQSFSLPLWHFDDNSVRNIGESFKQM